MNLEFLIDCPEFLERINFKVTLFNPRSKCSFYLSYIAYTVQNYLVIYIMSLYCVTRNTPEFVYITTL